MIQWVEVAESARAMVLGLVATRGSVLSRKFLPSLEGESFGDLLRGLRKSGVHLLRTGRHQAVRLLRIGKIRVRQAFRQAAREEKVALLGLALVLVFLSWP